MLNFLVGRFHVGTPDSEVRAAIAARLKPDLGAGERKAILAKAIRIHRANRRLFQDVMSGRVGR